jgi:hypothetical protein
MEIKSLNGLVMKAAEEGDAASVASLLAAKADPNWADSGDAENENWTPLH